MHSPDDPIQSAVKILRAGGLVALPTETVYGLGADATNPLAVAKIFIVKGRPSTNPLIVHVADADRAKHYCTQWPDVAQQLADAFWPGAITLVLPRSSEICDAVTAGGNTVGLRVPNHPLALALLKEFGGTIAAPSANRANHISPTSAADVLAELGDRVDLILDGGPCSVGIESTVIDLTPTLAGKPARILRPGGVSQAQIEQVIGQVNFSGGDSDLTAVAMSPGQHARHYSPLAPTYRFALDQQSAIIQTDRSIFILIGEQNKRFNVITLSANPVVYARELYHALREADQQQPDAIYIQMPPDQPGWTAVRDRVRRASVEL